MSSALLAARRKALASHRSLVSSVRWASSDSKDKYKVVVVGAGMSPLCGSDDVHQADWHRSLGSGGLTVANQIYNRFKAAGTPLNEGDIAVLDANDYHYYQVRTSRLSRCADAETWSLLARLDAGGRRSQAED